MGKQYIDPDLIAEVGLKLRRLRMERGLSQYIVDMDNDINTSRIENGNVNITLSTLSKLCSYYKISLKDFFDGIEIRFQE